MHTPHPDKEQLIALVSRLLNRSGLTIERVLARMQVHGCDISRATFENRFTTRIDLKPNIPSAWLLALAAALTERLTERERCTAAEALELARLTRLPLDQLSALAKFFPAAEFNAAFSSYMPAALYRENNNAEKSKIDPVPPGPVSQTIASSPPELQPSPVAEVRAGLASAPGGDPLRSPLRLVLSGSEAQPTAPPPLPASSTYQRRQLPLILALVLVSTISLGIAFHQWRQVQAERRFVLSQQLAARARDVLPDQLDLALLLSVEAYRAADTYEARDILLTALQTSPHLKTYLRGHTDWVWSVAFSPDSHTLASGSSDGTVRVWNVAGGQALSPPLVRHTGWVRSVVFSPDGKLLASGGDDQVIFLWDVVSKAGVTSYQGIRPPLTGHSGFITGLAFSPDGRILASGSADGTVRLWDMATGQPLGSPLTGHTSMVLSLAFSPDGQMLASAGADETIILWDISGISQSELGTKTNLPLAHALTGHQGAVLSVAFSPDGQTLASGSEDETIILWDVAARQPRGQPLLGHKAGVNAVSFSPDGQTLASGSKDKTIIYWDVAHRRPLGSPLSGHAGQILGLAFSPDGQTAASGSADDTIILWAVPLQQPLSQTLIGHTDTVHGLAFSPECASPPEGCGDLLASASHDFTVRLWDVRQRQAVGQPLSGHTGFVNTVAFSPDGQILASGSDDKTIRLWQVKTGQPLGSPLTNLDQSAVFQEVAFQPGSQKLLSNDEDGHFLLWDITTQRPLEPPLPLVGKPIALNPDGTMLATAELEISLWDMATSQLRPPPLKGYTKPVAGLAFSPDGETLAGGGEDNQIFWWDVASRRLHSQPLAGHNERIRSVAFSPDGRLLASGGEDGIVILWDAATHQPLGLPLHNGDRVWRVVFSPDSHTLASAGRNDGAIMLWDLNPESWQQRVCQIVTRNLTLAEWEHYQGEQPYQATCPTAPRPNSEVEATPTRTLTPTMTTLKNKLPAAGRIIEEFDSERGFIQTSPDVRLEKGQAQWHFKRNGGEQYVYRPILPFSGNVRLTVRGQVDSWTNNCYAGAGIGDKPGAGLSINFGWIGGGCPTRGSMIHGNGVALDYVAKDCDFIGNWLWIEPATPYTAVMTVLNETSTLAVDGAGQASGQVVYTGPYITLWVGNNGDGDWPECTGQIDSVTVEPLE